MAKVLKVSESGYYKWCARLKAPLTAKEIQEQILIEQIREIYYQSKKILGVRKITAEVRKLHETPINHKRVERLMRENGFCAKVSKRYVVTTKSDDNLPVAENLLEREFTAERANEKMVSDTTCIDTKEGVLYVAGILDLYGRMPVGLHMSKRNDKYLVLGALEDMLMRGCGKEGCIMHSDRGSTYASKAYRRALTKAGLVCSMSKKGDCWDNAPMESFWGR